jgi:hypothetical protein
LRHTHRPATFLAVTERLNELRRQRDLVKQHLDWLDAEITAEATADPTNVPLTDRPRFAARPGQPDAIGTVAEKATESLLEHYSAESRSAPARAKLGCWMAFAAAFVLLGLAVAAWFFLRNPGSP